MASNNKTVISKTFGIDIAALFRAVVRNIILILVCGVGLGTIAYMGITRFVPKQYSFTASVVVTSKDNSIQNLRAYRYNQAIAQYAGILNSDVYRDVVKNNLNDNIDITANNLQATALESSNTIVLKSTHENPEYAFKILKEAIKSYSEIEMYAMTGYSLRTLSNPNVQNMVGESNNAFLLSIAVGLLVLLIGMGLSMLLHLFNGKIDNEQQAIDKVDANFLGTIPFTKKTKNNSLLFMESEIKFEYKFAIKKIANAIDNIASKSGNKTILVSSVFENEGKSTIAANLALALEKIGKKVLILDMDLRKPALSKVLSYNIPSEREITNVLEKKLSYDDAITYDQSRKISYIVGTLSVNGSNITNGIVNLKEFLAQVSDKFDYIIIDSPPIAMAQDSELMGEWIDAMVMVVRQNQAQVSDINDSIDVMRESGTNVLGIVLNIVETSCIPQHIKKVKNRKEV